MATSWTNADKSGQLTYFTMEDGFYYLVGSDEDEILITQDNISWTNETKN